MEDARGDVPRLTDILTAMAKVRTFTHDGRDAFLASGVIQDAVIRNLEVMGEAAGNVSASLRSKHPEVPWSKMRGLASFARHEYWRIDLQRLWAAVEVIPTLEQAVSRIRADRARR